MTRPRYVTALVAAATMSCAAMAAPAPGASLTNTAPPQPVSTGHSAWGWGNPTPQGQNLAGVAFDGADGYAVGAFGTVLRSDDAGRPGPACRAAPPTTSTSSRSSARQP